MGSTFPLLLMDATRFSRIGVTAEILGTGFRPLNSTSAYASTPASSRYSTIRFRSLRSIFSYCARSPSLFKAHGHVPLARRFSHLSVACLTPVRLAPMHLILARAARLSLYSLPAVFVFCCSPNPAFSLILKDAPRIAGMPQALYGPSTATC